MNGYVILNGVFVLRGGFQINCGVKQIYRKGSRIFLLSLLSLSLCNSILNSERF